MKIGVYFVRILFIFKCMQILIFFWRAKHALVETRFEESSITFRRVIHPIHLS